MTTSEKLEVLEKMQKDWQACIDNPELVYTKTCDKGFCFWIYLKGYNLELLTHELRKDHPLSPTRFKINWYENYKEIGKPALVLRLEHLNRTIARLENELKIEL